MKSRLKSNILSFIFLFICNIVFSQYSISGYLDTPKKDKKVYLSLLKFDEQMTVSDSQVITSTIADSSGYFSFEGKLLLDKHALYRIHAEVDDGFGANQIYNNDDLKNLHNFIFSNNDTIIFQKNDKFWFSDYSNSNPIDKEWRDFREFGKQMHLELYSLTGSTLQRQSSVQYLYELKSYANSKDIHPLVTLILLSDVDQNILKQDIAEDPNFYNYLKEMLVDYYGETLYASQFQDLLTDLSKKETLLELQNIKYLVYILIAICLLLLVVIAFLSFKLRQAKKDNQQLANVSLTSQEEKVAELIKNKKTNKEIASELFISLSTVKTHIRNLYAKLEVNSRQEFIAKFKNQPRD